MAYAFPSEGALDYFPCQYGESRLQFRGPKPNLGDDYLAMIGGTETYGKFVPEPFAVLTARALERPMVNLGCVNAGPDVFLNDETILNLASRASLQVIQIMGAQNLSNRFYTVHPRRNDRFLGATPLLRSIFREVDFTEFHFTRHLLTSLRAVSPDRFEVVADELRASWVHRMRQLLARLAGPKILLWVAEVPAYPGNDRSQLRTEPMLVDDDMIAAILPLAQGYVKVSPSIHAQAAGTAGMAFGPMEALAAAGLPGPKFHAEVAAKLVAKIKSLS